MAHKRRKAPPAFGAILADSRKKRGLSQSDLAAHSHLLPSAIAHFEAGRRLPSFNNLRNLANALNVTADYLLGLPHGGWGTAFAHEDKLTTAQRQQVQDLIDVIVKRNHP